MRRLTPLALLLLVAGCAGDAPVPTPGATSVETTTTGDFWFVEDATARGVTFRHESGHGERPLAAEIIGGGAALFDMDDDGDLDLYLVQSGSLTATGAGSNTLYENSDGAFTDVTRETNAAANVGYGMGVAAGDYDDDGDVDLYVTNLGPNVLLRNDGARGFVDVTAAAGVGDPAWSASATFVDYDADGRLDLFVANYFGWSLDSEQDCYNSAGLLDYCLPTNYNTPLMDRLYRNRGDGTFEDVTKAAGLGAAFGNGLGVVAEDFTGDGHVDLFVANDTMMNQLWVNQLGRGVGGFVDESLFRGCALDEHGQTKAGMGVDAADLDDDGDPDLLVVNLEYQTDSFFRNDEGFFTDRTGAVGLGGDSRRYTRFGVGFVDFDNDGRLDLFQANGRVMMDLDRRGPQAYAEPNLLWRGSGDGRFERQAITADDTALVAVSRAAAFGDVDGDGGVDVVVVNNDGPTYLLMNAVPDRGNWIRFDVRERSGRHALGAVMALDLDGRRITRTVKSGFGFLASSDPRVHVGTGDRTRVTNVVVRWADGVIESFGDHDCGGVVTLRRGDGG